MAFFQAPPELGNQYDDDPLLKELLTRMLPTDQLATLEPGLRELGEQAGRELYLLQLADRLNEPVLTQWDPWGNRIDHIELTAVWEQARRITAEYGLVATAYDAQLGPYARTHQFARNFVVQPSLDLYSCPLAMTDGAARTLLDSGNRALAERAVPRLTSRDPRTMWTSGQWMTERTGGSDVGISQTVATPTPQGWRLCGTKWFTSATTSEMALTLARPEGAGPGGRGLALFYVETRDASGRLNGIRINRLKDKLGTRKVPTAELDLDGTPAQPVQGLDNGVRAIAPMLNVTRTWNAMAAAWGMRRALALANDYSRKRIQFGGPLDHKPLHVDTIAGLEAQAQGACLLAFSAAELLCRVETGAGSDAERLLLRLVTPLAKLTTGKQAVTVASEVLECFGGAGYVEDTGLPSLLRDAQVLPIWEGTTNVLSLDVLRAAAKHGTLDAFRKHVDARLAGATHPHLDAAATVCRGALEHAAAWLSGSSPVAAEAGARRFALTLGRTLELALLVEHAAWALEQRRGERALGVAHRFAAAGVDRIVDL
jgi:alkylation response protein AidB-like acyl-CoA dehydrogenase